MNDKLKGVIGAYVGYSHLNYKDHGEATSWVDDKLMDTGSWNDKTSANGVVYGVRLGGIYNFNTNNELEFGVKLEQARYGSVKDDDWDLKPKVNNYGAYIGYNYKF